MLAKKRINGRTYCLNEGRPGNAYYGYSMFLSIATNVKCPDSSHIQLHKTNENRLNHYFQVHSEKRTIKWMGVWCGNSFGRSDTNSVWLSAMIYWFRPYLNDKWITHMDDHILKCPQSKLNRQKFSINIAKMICISFECVWFSCWYCCFIHF